MPKNFRVLIVDDSAEDIAALMECLNENYVVNADRNGKKCLDRLAENVKNGSPQPDVIMMDVSMPELDGYDTCRMIRDNPDYASISVIFLSAHDSQEEKLKGFEVGGYDFITKPFEPMVVIQKIQRCIDYQKAKDSLEKEKNEAFDTAMTAMSAAGELGIVLEFMREITALADIDALGKLLIRQIAQYGLNAVVVIRGFDNPYYFSNKGPITTLEQELLELMTDKGRIIELGARTIINFKNCTVIIKNMPEDDDLRGRLRDNVPLMLEGLETKLTALQNERMLQKIVKRTQQALAEFEQDQLEHRKKTRALLESLPDSLQNSFLSWGLEEQQEQTLIDMVDNVIDATIEHEAAGKANDEKLKDILRDISLGSI